jgi:ABC-type tungstate transport system substrate-binding protein
MWVVFDVFKDAVHSRVMMALADSLLSVGGQFTTVMGLLMYLGLVKAGPSKRSGK